MVLKWRNLRFRVESLFPDGLTQTFSAQFRAPRDRIFPSQSSSPSSRSARCYFRLSAHPAFSAHVVFFYDSVFIINCVGSSGSAFPETGRDRESLTLGEVGNSSRVRPQPESPRAHARARSSCWAVLGLVSVVSVSSSFCFSVPLCQRQRTTCRDRFSPGSQF